MFRKFFALSLPFVFFLFLALPLRGQFMDCGSGLLQMPTAMLESSGTFMITNNFVNKHAVPEEIWGYHTFAYGFSVSFWSRVEVRYICTILDGKRKPNPSSRDLILFNQDRHLSGKVLLLKEGDFGWTWAPNVAIGADDVDMGMFSPRKGNGFFTRLYAVTSKSFYTSVGNVGAHMGYQFGQFSYYQPSGLYLGVDWTPVWVDSPAVSLKAIAEYDARTFNIGCIASFWENRFEAMFELMALKWVNFGVRYKLLLKPY